MSKPIKLEASVYYSENSRRIHLDIGGIRTNVCGEPGRTCYHPELFRKLGTLLREAGKPAPGGKADADRT